MNDLIADNHARKATYAHARRWIAAAAAAAALAGCSQPAGPPAAGDSAPPPSATERGHADPGMDSSASAPPQASAAKLAGRFARAWVKRDLPAQKWWAKVAPLCTPQLARALRSTDPGNVPASEVTGSPEKTRGGPSPVYAIATDAGTLTVTVSIHADAWAVADIGFERKVTR